MDIKPPECLDFQKLVVKCECGKLLERNENAECPFKDCECGKNNFYLRKWKINVPVDDSMIWATVMSYLLSANLGDDDVFQQKLKLLTENKDLKDIKHCISSFNPFLNRYSCFFNKEMKLVVSDFRAKLNGNSEKDLSIYKKLENVSQLLKCSILLLSCSKEGEWLSLKSFPRENSESSIALYFCPDDISSKETSEYRFSFGLKKKLGLQKKKAALTKILKQSNIHKAMRTKLMELSANDENFLISILQKGSWCIISHLYRTPYLMHKLADAGYETDPRAVDTQGLSAIYYALNTGDYKLLYILFDYAANNCYYSMNSVRNPDNSILSNLQNLGKTFESFNCENEEMLLHLKQFNSFLTKIAENILRIKSGSIYKDISSTEKSEAAKRKDIMSAILKTYIDFFWLRDTNSGQEEESLLDHFISNRNYYENLDYAAAHFFFDHIFLLKERLTLKGEDYSELESSFFFSILVTKYFISGTHTLNYFYDKCRPEQTNVFECKNIFKDPNRKYLLVIPLLERIDLRDKICKFIDQLESPVEDNFRGNLPESEIPLILSDLPEIKDEFMICKLMYYLEIALNTKVTDIKSVLVIEMTLQVLGESLAFGKNNSFSLCRLLLACLNKDTEQNIKHIRNVLSHPEKYGFALRFEPERDLFLFHGVQSEIQKIYEAFQVVFDLQQLRVVDFIIGRGSKFLKDYCDGNSSLPKSFPLKSLKNAEIEINYECQRIREFKISLHRKKVIYKNPFLFENVIKTAKKDFENKSIWERELSGAVEKVKEIIWPFNYLMNILYDDCRVLNDEMKKNFQKCYNEILKSTSIDNLKIKQSELISCADEIVNEILSRHQKNVKNILLSKTVSIEKLKKILKGNVFLSEEDKGDIKKHISPIVENAALLKKTLESKIKNIEKLTPEEGKKFEELTSIFSNKKLDKLRKACRNRNDPDEALEILTSISKPIEDLNKMLSENFETLQKNNFKMLAEKLKFSDDVKDKLRKLYTGKREKPCNDRIYNLLTRIRQLKAIIIEEHSEICELWSKAKNPKTIQYAKHKIVRRYIREREVQASVEMLYFDCMNILGKQGRVGMLGVKSSNLYTGVNLRNVLSHGNPTLQGMGKLIDPEDLPSVLVEEMLQLIEDEPILQAMQDLCNSTKDEFKTFHEIMNDKNDHTYKKLRDLISGSSKWKNYSYLIPQSKQTVAAEVVGEQKVK